MFGLYFRVFLRCEFIIILILSEYTQFEVFSYVILLIFNVHLIIACGYYIEYGTFKFGGKLICNLNLWNNCPHVFSLMGSTCAKLVDITKFTVTFVSKCISMALGVYLYRVRTMHAILFLVHNFIFWQSDW